MSWAGQYIVDRYYGQDDVSIIHIGDHWAMNSLSVHNNPLEAENLRISDDIEAGEKGMDAFEAPFIRRNHHRPRARRWYPQRKWFFKGNHEFHIERELGNNPKYEGTLHPIEESLERRGWEVFPFLEVRELEGIFFSHYFVNNTNGRPLGGMIETRIKSVGASFVQGHQQGLKTGILETIGGRRRGIVAGSYYCKAEAYRGPQASTEWRGILVLHEASNGDFDLMEVSLPYLCRKYQGMSISDFLMSKYGIQWGGR